MMETHTHTASDGVPVTYYMWPTAQPKLLIHIAHGMGEHAQRYDGLADQLNQQGYAVLANDHRGHGATGASCLGYMGPDGWNRVLADAYEFNLSLRAQYPGVPLVLLGHSMGAMMSQQYITRYGTSIDALVLSGSPGFKAQSINPIPGWILSFELWRHGPSKQSDVMQGVLFGNANKPFAGPDATGFEWLSRDADEVAKYVADPQCGFVLSTGSLKDLFGGSISASNADAIELIPKDLPIYVMSGSEDPVHSERADIERMLEAYRVAGLNDVTLKWYVDGRHEMFNETNKAEVVEDMCAWLSGCLPS